MHLEYLMGKQKSPGGIPPGVFCFLKLIQTINDLIFISWWFINISTGNVFFHRYLRATCVMCEEQSTKDLISSTFVGGQVINCVK